MRGEVFGIRDSAKKMLAGIPVLLISAQIVCSAAAGGRVKQHHLKQQAGQIDTSRQAGEITSRSIKIAARVMPPGDPALSEDEVNEALKDLQSYKSLKKFACLSAVDKKALKENFLPGIKNLQIEHDSLLNARAAKIAEKIFLVHNLTDQCETVVIRNPLPTVLTWKLTFVTLTTRTLELLTDEEVAALIAHEIGHLYYTEELTKAWETGDARLARIVELKADAVALETLDTLQIPLSNLLSAVAKLIAARSSANIKSFTDMSPSLEDRESLAREYKKRSAAKTLFLHSPVNSKK